MTDKRKQNIQNFVNKLYKVHKDKGIYQFINLIDEMLESISKKVKKSKIDCLRVEFLNDVRKILVTKGIVSML